MVSATERPSRPRISRGDATAGASLATRCTHCGLIVPGERRSSRFCCAGCEAVHELLHAEGLTRFYELGGAAAGAVGAVPRAAERAWLPELEVRATARGVTRLLLDVQGIRCAACVWLLQAVWKRQPGAIDVRIAPSLGRATLVYREGSDAAAAFVDAAARLGYRMAPPSRDLARDDGLLLRFGICAAIAMNAMLLAVSLYAGLDTAAADGSLRALFGWVLCALGTLAVAIGGPVFVRSALAGLRAGVVHMDLPIALGLTLAWAGSMYGQLTGGAVWFDTVALFVAFMLGGRFLLQRTLARSRDQVLADDGVEHLRARRVEAGAVQVVPVLALRTGDELLLAPGDLLPVRAVLLDEHASFSLDWIDGESEPRAFARGDELPAGAFLAGRAAARVQARADHAASGIAQLLAQEPLDREPTRGRVRFWERLNRGYAAGVLVAATLAGLLWALLEPARALPVAISVLVVTCPCAMGIATPLAFHLALAALRRTGVFVRTRSLLDKVRCVRHVVFDKTGTVTFGGLRAQVRGELPAGLLPVVATMAASSNHPVSQAVLAALPAAPFVPGLAVHEQPGGGLAAAHGGAAWRLGGRAFCGLSPAGDDERRECVVTRDGVLVAAFDLDEDFRAGAADEMRSLQARGLEVHLMSGDRASRVAAAAAHLGVPAANAHGGMSPAAKAAAVASLDRHDTLMVGDGLNDAPAFAAAFCAGTPAMDRPVLPARADFFFRGAQAGAISSLLRVADVHARVVRSNLALALVYNATALVVCFAGAMTPLLCAVLMPISSLALVLHTSVRMRRARRPA